jgi:hypothetical protein
MERTQLDPDSLNRPDWNSLKANYSKHDVGEAYFVGRMDQIGLQTEHWGIDMRDDDEGLIFDNKMDLRLWEPLDGQDVAPQPQGFAGEDTTFTRTTVDGSHELYEQALSNGLAASDIDQSRVGEESWALKGVVDIKTKANEDWLGVLNLRHLVHYAEWAEQYDVPVFLYFTMVDMDAERVGERNILVPVEPWDHFDAYSGHFDRDTDEHTNWSSVTEDCPYVSRSFRAPDGNPVVQIDEDYYHDFDWFVEEVL